MTPPSERNLEKVSCKAALYNPDRTKVLLVEYLPGKYGLPGGHIEQGESPEEAMQRELREGLGVENEIVLKKRDFWRHNNDKIVLGFIGEIDESTRFAIDKNEIQAAVWTDVAAIESGDRSAGGYDTFIVSSVVA